MKILIVCSKNSASVAPFIIDQVEALREAGVNCEYFTVEGKGITGYLRNYSPLIHKIRDFQPDIIHAHYGLSGLFANLQRKVPVITTYHGSDINNPKVRRFSKVAIKLSAWNIFVSQKNSILAGVKKNFSLIPCGVDTRIFMPVDKALARNSLGLETQEKYVLFAGAFDNKVKNPELAIEAVSKVPGARLLELKGYTRTQVAELMNAVDVCLMTSHSEGSPQFIKEAMACNCPIVSVDVGDVAEVIVGIEYCRVVERNANEIASNIQELFTVNNRTKGYEKINNSGLGGTTVAGSIKALYQNIIENA